MNFCLVCSPSVCFVRRCPGSTIGLTIGPLSSKASICTGIARDGVWGGEADGASAAAKGVRVLSTLRGGASPFERCVISLHDLVKGSAPSELHNDPGRNTASAPSVATRECCGLGETTLVCTRWLPFLESEVCSTSRTELDEDELHPIYADGWSKSFGLAPFHSDTTVLISVQEHRPHFNNGLSLYSPSCWQSLLLALLRPPLSR